MHSTPIIKPAVKVFSETFFASVDYSKSIEEMIENGKYERIEPFIGLVKTQNIKPYQRLKEVRQYEMRILHTKKYYCTEKILKAIQEIDIQYPWKPARLEHLLAFGANYPQEQAEHQVIALGTPMRYGEYTHFPRLENLHHRRGVSIIEDDGIWQLTDTFLIFRPL